MWYLCAQIVTKLYQNKIDRAFDPLYWYKFENNLINAAFSLFYCTEKLGDLDV